MARKLSDYGEYKKNFLGRGAFGKVYKAFDKHLKKEIALKIVKYREGAQEKKNVDIFMKEKLKYIVEFHGYFVEGEKLCILMHFCKSPSLRSIIDEKCKLKEYFEDETIKTWSNQLMCVLIYLENNSIIHNDIKPANILINSKNDDLSQKSSILVVDIGEAQLTDQTMSTRAGTSIYIAPERANGQEGSTKSDMWSCGVVIYELIHLELPFQRLGKFLKGCDIKYNQSPIGKLFIPILKESEPESRLSPYMVCERIKNPSIEPINKSWDLSKMSKRKYLSDLIRKLSEQASLKKIQSVFPKEEIDNYIDIMNLNEIDQLFERRSILIISGFAGLGKTTLAREYANMVHYSKNYTVVWFLADEKTNIDEGIRRLLMEDLEVDPHTFASMDDREKVSIITNFISNNGNPFLFVFDNIDENEMSIVQYIYERTPANLKIILTTRNVGLHKMTKIKNIELNELNHNQAKQYFVHRLSCKIQSEEKMNYLYDGIFTHKDLLTPYHLSNIVTAIEAHIESEGITSENLPGLVDQLNKVDLNTAEYIINTKIKNDMECEKLLWYLPYFDPDEISNEILNMLIKDIDVQKTVAKFVKYNLIKNTYIQGKKYMQVHRLTVKSIKTELKDQKERKSQTIKNILVILNRKLKEIHNNSAENLKIYNTLYKHLNQIIKKKFICSETGKEILQKIVWAEHIYKFNNKRAIEVILIKLKVIKNMHKDQPDHPDIAQSLNDLAVSYSKSGNEIEAIKLYKEALEMRRRIYQHQPVHPDIAQCLNNLAVSFGNSGNLPECLKYTKEALEMRRQIYKEQLDHPDIAQSLYSLAVSYSNSGNMTECLKYTKESLEMRRRIYKDQPDHPDIAQSLNSLATSYSKSGNETKAIKSFKEALEMRRRIYQHQPDHPEIAQSIYSLAVSYTKSGNETETIKLYKEALDMRRRIYIEQPDHPDIAQSLNDLAVSYSKSGNEIEAIKLYKEALEMRRRIYKDQPVHPDIAQSLTTLAVSYSKSGNETEAIKLKQESLDMRRRIYIGQPDHPEIAQSLNSLALSYSKFGNELEAIKLHKVSLEMRRRIYVEQTDHPEIAQSLNNMAVSFGNSGKLTECLKYTKEALEMRRRIYKDQPDHPDIAQSLYSLAMSYSKSENDTDAIQFFREALEIRRQIYRELPDHPDIAQSLFSLAVSYGNSGNLPECLKYTKEALEMRRRIHKHQPDHPDIAQSLYSLAMSYTKSGNETEAIKFKQEALEMRRRIYKHQPDHLDIAQSLFSMAASYSKSGNELEAIKFYKEALDMRLRIYKDQPDRLDIILNIYCLACSHFKINDNIKALELNNSALEKALRVFALIPDHPYLISIRELNNLLKS